MGWKCIISKNFKVRLLTEVIEADIEKMKDHQIMIKIFLSLRVHCVDFSRFSFTKIELT